MYYEYRRGHYVLYWFFYPYNRWERDGLTETHEADWERIVVRLDSDDLPIDVAYYWHYCKPGKTLTWSEMADPPQGLSFGDPIQGSPLEPRRTHPIVWSALGGHASYPDNGLDPDHPGEHTPSCFPDTPISKDSTGIGPLSIVWATWRRMADARTQPWYGFGGAWGYGKGETAFSLGGLPNSTHAAPAKGST